MANLEESRPNEMEYYAIYPLGLMPMVIISSETLRKVREATNEDDEPPKPRGGKRIPIGRVALGNT